MVVLEQEDLRKNPRKGIFLVSVSFDAACHSGGVFRLFRSNRLRESQIKNKA